MKYLFWPLCPLLLIPSVSECELSLQAHLVPSSVSLAVGETAPSPQASISRCGEPRHTVRLETWTSENPQIASVNPDTGVITGVSSSETTVVAYAEDGEANCGGTFRIPVTVVVLTNGG
jgi:uncharacterized protein YjdB